MALFFSQRIRELPGSIQEFSGNKRQGGKALFEILNIQGLKSTTPAC